QRRAGDDFEAGRNMSSGILGGTSTVLSRNEIRNHIDNVWGIPVKRERAHATEYGTKDHPFYLKKTNDCPLVVHPDLMPILRVNPISGVEVESEPYKNTNLAAFPKPNPVASSYG
ncbi:MAG: hypothetical protein ACREDL_21950, partial [Bradyrhizobium sp.]